MYGKYIFGCIIGVEIGERNELQLLALFFAPLVKTFLWLKPFLEVETTLCLLESLVDASLFLCEVSFCKQIF